MAVGTADVEGSLADHVVAGDILVHDLDLQEVVLACEGQDVFPDWLFASFLTSLSALLLSSQQEDTVGILNKRKLTMLEKSSVSWLN